MVNKNKLIEISANTWAIFGVGALYTLVTPAYGNITKGDLFAQNLGFALGTGVFFLPVIFLLRKLLPQFAKNYAIFGFRMYAVSVTLATLIFLPIRFNQAVEEKQVYEAGSTLAKPLGSLYASCMGMQYLIEQCSSYAASINISERPNCRNLIPTSLPEAVKSEFRDQVGSTKTKEMLKAEVFDRIDNLLNQSDDKNGVCVKASSDMLGIFKSNEINFQNAMSLYLLAMKR